MLFCWLLALAALFGFTLPYLKARKIFYAEHNAHIAHTSLPIHGGFYGLTNSLFLALCVWGVWSVAHQSVLFYFLEPLYHTQLENNAFWRMEVIEAVHSGESPSPIITSLAQSYHYLRLLGSIITATVMMIMVVIGIRRSLRHLRKHVCARARNERRLQRIFQGCAIISVIITCLIFLSVATEAIRFFGAVPLSDFLVGTQWSPQTAIRSGQTGASGVFGFLPLLIGTLMITIIALCVAVPLGLFTAIYLNEYATPAVRRAIKPLLEVLAGIPTVVYGFFAITTMTPLLQRIGLTMQLSIDAESALAAGMVMGIMLIPLISSMSDDAMKAVPKTLRDASLALGATRSETMKHALLPASLSGIVGGILLATSRAIGETMIVVMAAGLAANFTFNPLESVTTITVQIVALLGGDQDFSSNKTLAAFALGLTLFFFTLLLNIIALITVRRYKQHYE